MPLEVRIEDETGRVEGPTWWHPRSSELLCQFGSATACLRFIDPYGDTIFNQLQLPVLIDEVQAFMEAAPDPEARSALHSLIEFLDRARDQPHIYVRFFGD